MFSSINEFELNRNGVSTNQDFISLIDLLSQIRDFLSELGYLTFGRDMSVFRQTGVVNGNLILDSAARTMESIRFCCMNANFADAYSLLRKYREDEKNIWDWVHNRQKDLHIGSVLKCIASHPSARKAVKEFQLKDSFDKLADKLNNYVHSNGHLFYNESYDRLVTKHKIKAECKEFGEVAIFITVSFLFLVVLINPMLIMSYDYTDYLEVGDTPPDGSQYWVAPFVSDFLINHKNVLDDKCDSYLREKTGMQI